METHTQHPGNPRKKAGWRGRTALGLMAILAGFGWLRLYNAVRLYDYLSALNLWPSPLYLAISGAGMGLVFSAAGWLWVWRSPHAVRAVRVAGVLFLAWFWADRIWLSTPDRFLDLLAISLITSLAIVLLMTILVDNKKGCAGDSVYEQQN
jgi:hypothetical protein